MGDARGERQMFDDQTEVAITESTSTKKFNRSSMFPLALLVSLATFNVRVRLGNESNYMELNSDCDKFNCDIISLQETFKCQIHSSRFSETLVINS